MNPARAKQRSLDEYYPDSHPLVKLTLINDRIVPVSLENWKNQLAREKRGIR